MSFWSFLTGGQRYAAPAVLPLSPFAEPSDEINRITVEQLWPEHAGTNVLDRATALRIPAVKRSHDIVCGVLARMPWRQYNHNTESAQQPEWLVNTSTGVAPRNLRWGVVSDLFMSGWAMIGFAFDGDSRPADALHIPRDWWSVHADGEIEVNDRVAPRYLARLVPINLGYGSNGMMTDALDTMRDARTIEGAYRDRIENPIAQTVLSIAGERWDYWTKQEREEFRKKWIESRSSKGGATAMKPDWVSVDYPTNLPTDLFESGRNATRLDIANHAGLPADLLEGSKQGSAGAIEYSGKGDTRNELWDFGLSKYADAIESRLSLDDVCDPGMSIRVDTSHYLTTPTPTTPPTSED